MRIHRSKWGLRAKRKQHSSANPTQKGTGRLKKMADPAQGQAGPRIQPPSPEPSSRPTVPSLDAQWGAKGLFLRML